MNYQGLMEITKIENIADDVYEMTLKGEGAKYISQPGQFINIKINESLQPYLRRPMSISDYDENTIVIVFKVVGQGTEILKNKQIGDQLDCLIGLGNGFTVQEGKALLIGGGLGTPPLYNLGKKLKEKGVEVTTVLGFSSKKDVFYIDKFQEHIPCFCLAGYASLISVSDIFLRYVLPATGHQFQFHGILNRLYGHLRFSLE